MKVKTGSLVRIKISGFVSDASGTHRRPQVRLDRGTIGIVLPGFYYEDLGSYAYAVVTGRGIYKISRHCFDVINELD